MNKQAEYAANLKAALEEYEDALILAIDEGTEGGAVIGLAHVSRQQLRGFFDSVSPMEWAQAAVIDPEGALAMLEEYAEAEGVPA